MPPDQRVLGFTNHWFEEAMRHTTLAEVEGATIRQASAPHFLAMKLEAFADRGEGDHHACTDLEDVLLLVKGRCELGAELAGAHEGVWKFIASRLRNLLANEDFLHALPGHVEPGNDMRVMKCPEALAAL